MSAAQLIAPGAQAAGAGCCDQESSGFAAYGTLIQVCSVAGPPEQWVTIEGVGDINGPSSSMGETETTSHSSGAPVRTFVATLADPGELSFPCFWNPTDPTQSITSPYGLEFLFWNRINTKWRLIEPDASHYTRVFCGFVKSIAEASPTQGIAQRNVAIRITSPITVTAAAISLTPAAATIANAGGPSTFEVNAGGSQTPWTAVSDAPWITVTAPVAPTVGDETVNLTVALGTGALRTGHVLVPELGLTFTVTQSAT